MHPVAQHEQQPVPRRVQIRRRVHPRGTRISVHERNVIHYRAPDDRLNLNIVPVIDNSIVAIDCYFNPLIENHVRVVFPLVLTAVRAQIDLAAFRRGVGVTLTIDWMKDYDGLISNIAIAQLDLSKLCTAFDENKNYHALKAMAEEDQAMSLAINDLILAQTALNYAEINCARAVEGIR